MNTILPTEHLVSVGQFSIILRMFSNFIPAGLRGIVRLGEIYCTFFLIINSFKINKSIQIDSYSIMSTVKSIVGTNRSSAMAVMVPALTVMLVPCATGTSLHRRMPRVQRVRSKDTRVNGMTMRHSPRSAMARFTM